MARILMAWEIGQHFGHVLPLLPVARALRALGHEVIFALKDLREVGARVAEDGFPLLQAPAHPDVLLRPGPRQPRSMAEILGLFGFTRPDVLPVFLSAWRELILRVDPELLVASYAPTAQLAARWIGRRSALLGTAFEVPPARTPLPPIRLGEQVCVEDLQQADAAVVAAVNQALRPRGLVIEAAHQVFAADRQLLWTFPEMDAHAAERQASSSIYTGPIFSADEGAEVTWPGAHKKRVFGYVRQRGGDLERLVDGLESLPADVLLVRPGLGADELERLQRTNVTVVGSPVKLGAALAEADALVSYGGHGTVCAALLKGVPAVLFPHQAEAASIAWQACRLGAATLADANDPKSIVAACATLLANRRFDAAAARFQKRYEGYSPALQAERIARALHEMLAGVP